MNDLMRMVAASRPTRLDDDTHPDPAEIMAHPRPLTTARRPKSRRLLLAGAVPAALAIAVAGGLIIQSNAVKPQPLTSPAQPLTSPTTRPKPATARDVLLVAAEQTAQGATSGRYWRTRIEQGERSAATMRRVNLDHWLPTSVGAVEVMVVTMNGNRGVKKATAAHGPLLDGVPITVPGLAALPTDPAALRALLIKRGDTDEPVDWQLFVSAQQLVTELPVSPAVRSAAFRMLAEVPGVRLIGDVKDQRGRPGVAIGYQRNGNEARLIVDAAQGRALAAESWHGRTLLGYQVIIDAGYTNANPPS
jgi:hypothetical protein